METILVKLLASTVQARRNCTETGNTEWFAKHTDTLAQLVRDHMPIGSGWDHGTKLDLDASHADKLVFRGAYHHMNETGYYDGWTDHTVTVTPALAHGYHIRISGRDRNEIKEYLHETFSFALETRLTWDHAAARYRNVKVAA